MLPQTVPLAIAAGGRLPRQKKAKRNTSVTDKRREPPINRDLHHIWAVSLG
jgi:hypothetical protein